MTSEATGLTTRAEAQDTFVALLTTPFVSARVASASFAAVLQHRAQLTQWSGRLAYRLVIAGSVARLHRDPAGPQRTAAPAMGAPPSRRELTLVALTAAACEDADMTSWERSGRAVGAKTLARAVENYGATCTAAAPDSVREGASAGKASAWTD